MSAPFSKQQPQTTKVLIRTDPDAASVNDDSADAERRQGGAKQPLLRHTRSKHTLDEPLLQATPKQKRSRWGPPVPSPPLACLCPCRITSSAGELDQEPDSGLVLMYKFACTSGSRLNAVVKVSLTTM